MNMIRKTIAAAMIGVLALGLYGCSSEQIEQEAPSQTDFTLTSVSETLDRSTIFTSRDLSASTEDAVYSIDLSDG